VAFFDRDNDGVLWPMDTYVGFRRIGFNRIISFLAVPFIHGSFSYVSTTGQRGRCEFEDCLPHALG
jgi:peroxygenase